MKVLFLDIDGVLNSHAWWELRKKQGSPRKLKHFATAKAAGARDEYMDYQIDHRCVSRLNELIERTGAKVVISSSWRILHPLEEIMDVLKRRGFRGEVVGQTPNLASQISQHLHSGVRRGTEIQAWLDEHPEVECIAIVDDDSDMAHLRNRLIKTSMFEGGLQDVHVDRLALLLGEAGDGL